MATIQNRFTYEEAKAYYAAIKNGIDEVCGACYEFAKVAEQMNGKVLNKRFVDAVNDALVARFGYFDTYGPQCPNVHIFKRDDYTRAYNYSINLFKRSYDKPANNGYSHAIYFDKELNVEIRVGVDNLIDGKRINAEEFAKAARCTADYNLRVYERYREALLRWDEELQAVKELNAYIESVNKELEKRVSCINQLFINDNMTDLSRHNVWTDAKFSYNWYKKNENK